MASKVDLGVVLKLKRMFEDKKWNQIENNDYVYEHLCALSENIGEDPIAHDLFFSLIGQYHWMSYNEYSIKINKLLEDVFLNSGREITKVYIFPIIKPEDEKRNKSGNSISYMIKCNKPYIVGIKHIIFEEVTLFEDLSSLSLKEKEFLLLVDDYIGSGETLSACIAKVKDVNPVLEDRILIASIAIQRDTIAKLDRSKLFYGMEVTKGISDKYESPDKEKHIDTMLSLERKLISGRQFSLGYEQSEGLVTMLRTPDNTFPIFWHEYKKSTGLYPPFPRE